MTHMRVCPLGEHFLALLTVPVEFLHAASSTISMASKIAAMA